MKRVFKKAIPAIFAVLVFLAFFSGHALAHGVRVFAYPEGGRLVGEGYFSGGKKARNCPVMLQDMKGNVLAKAATDGEGRFSFGMPQADPPFLLVLNAGQGHRAEYRLTAADLGDNKGRAAAKPEAKEASQSTGPFAKGGTPAPRPETGPGLEAMVERAVARGMASSMKSLNARLNKMAEQQGPSLRDIIGGLGWIMGLVGIAAYFKSREKKNK